MVPVFLRKPRLQLFLFVFFLTAILFWQTRAVLTPFVLSLVMAYLILPLVNLLQCYLPLLLQQRNLARPAAIMVVYLLGLLFMIAAVSVVLPPIVGQAVSLYESADELYDGARELINEGLAQYEEQIPPNIQSQIEERLQEFNPTTVLDLLFSGVRRAIGAISNTISFILGLIVIPFWLFFILNDEAAVINGAMTLIPLDLRPDVEAVRIIFDRVLSAYIRGQLIVATVLGVAISVGLFILGVRYSLLLGLSAGVLGLIPYVGAILGAILAIFVALLQSPPLALWVIGLFILVQQFENVFLSPKIMGNAVALHPAIIMVVIVVGASLFGIIGALMAVPLTAILRDVVHYFYIRAGDEQLGPISALEMVGYGDRVTPAMRQMVVAKLAT